MSSLRRVLIVAIGFIAGVIIPVEYAYSAKPFDGVTQKQVVAAQR